MTANSTTATEPSVPFDGKSQTTHSDGVLVALEPHASPTHEKPTPTPTPTSAAKALPPSFYTPFFSAQSTRRKPSPIRGLFPLEQTPGVISLLAGKPNPASFPIVDLQLAVRSAADPPGAQGTRIVVGKDALADGLQYGPTPGYVPLVKWFMGLQAYSHGRREAEAEGWRISMGSGSQDSLYKAFHALITPGDPILVESPAYAGVLPMLDELRADIVPVNTDANGILSSSLREILENWPASKPLPKALYTVPYGCNPTGMTATEDRRREVLALSAKYNFIILEDDPYYYLYYGPQPRPKSYFALELEQPEVGRVLRFDSVSKILSAGMRIGFATGPAPLLDAMDLHTGTANLQVSTLTQVITLAILDSWGYDGFWAHTEAVSAFYRARRDVFEAAMRRHLDGLVDWVPPESGMFFWFKLRLPPRADGDGAAGSEDSEDIIRNKAFKNGVLALPGTSFMPDGKRTAYVRASFSLLEPETVDEALKRLREVLVEAQAQGPSAA